MVKSDNTVTVRLVKVKQQDDQQASIEEGLRGGDIVVTSGFGPLREGEKVTVDSAQGGGQVDQGKGKGKGKGKRVSKE